MGGGSSDAEAETQSDDEAHGADIAESSAAARLRQRAEAEPRDQSIGRRKARFVRLADVAPIKLVARSKIVRAAVAPGSAPG